MSYWDVYHGDEYDTLTFKRNTLTYDEFIDLLDEFERESGAPTVPDLVHRIKQQSTPENYGMLCDVLDLMADTAGIESDRKIASLWYKLHADEISSEENDMFSDDPIKVKNIISVLEEAGLFQLPEECRPNRTALLKWLTTYKRDFNDKIPNRHEVERLLTEVIKTIKTRGFELPHRTRAASDNDKYLKIPVR